jgi:hypothetical protein
MNQSGGFSGFHVEESGGFLVGSFAGEPVEVLFVRVNSTLLKFSTNCGLFQLNLKPACRPFSVTEAENCKVLRDVLGLEVLGGIGFHVGRDDFVDIFSGVHVAGVCGLGCKHTGQTS